MAVRADRRGNGVPGGSPTPSLHERFRVLRRHIYDMCEDKGEYIAMQQARTHAAWYMHGLRGAATLRRECCGMLHFTDLDRVIEHAWELQRETR
ncbi:tRNA-dihydrouridine synthase [Ruthenibacterium lactatiformans]|uniref:tRNA-dihydrouridine synthase n=1 Tax=Ruthenibacterium lactatiformans TaxID=1550024 RepID=UPI00311A02DE